MNETRFPNELSRLAEDMAGGLLVTLPPEKDFRHSVIGKYIENTYREWPMYLRRSEFAC